MKPKGVCVLDLDETCGFFEGDKFYVRPLFTTFVHFLKLIGVDIILWSTGDDEYVLSVVNGFLPELQKHAFKIFARYESDYSHFHYNYHKASWHVRHLYKPETIVLFGVDDLVNNNMDEEGYDVLFYIKPYTKVNSCDKELLKLMAKITEGLARTIKLDDVQRRPVHEIGFQRTNEMDPVEVAKPARRRQTFRGFGI